MTRSSYDNVDVGRYRGIDDVRTKQPTDATLEKLIAAVLKHTDVHVESGELRMHKSAVKADMIEAMQAAAPTPSGEGVDLDTFIERTRAALEDVTRRVKKLSRHNATLLGQCIDDAIAALLRARPDNLDTLAAAAPINSEGLERIARRYVERVANGEGTSAEVAVAKADLEWLAALEAVRAGDGR